MQNRPSWSRRLALTACSQGARQHSLRQLVQWHCQQTLQCRPAAALVVQIAMAVIQRISAVVGAIMVLSPATAMVVLVTMLIRRISAVVVATMVLSPATAMVGLVAMLIQRISAVVVATVVLSPTTALVVLLVLLIATAMVVLLSVLMTLLATTAVSPVSAVITGVLILPALSAMALELAVVALAVVVAVVAAVAVMAAMLTKQIVVLHLFPAARGEWKVKSKAEELAVKQGRLGGSLQKKRPAAFWQTSDVSVLSTRCPEAFAS